MTELPCGLGGISKSMQITSYLADADSLVVGTVVRYEGRLWLVGMVNDSRARLDPLTGMDRTIGDQTFQSYGSSVSVAPNAFLPQADEVEVASAHQRLQELTARPERAPRVRRDRVARVMSRRRGKQGLRPARRRATT